MSTGLARLKRGVSLSLRHAVMLTSVAMVMATGVLMLLLSTSTADHALEEMTELNDKSVSQCFGTGRESLEMLATMLAKNVNSEMVTLFREELRTIEFAAVYLAKQCSIGPPPGEHRSQWLEKNLMLQLVHMLGIEDIASSGLGIIMPSETEDPFELAERDFVWYNNNPLARKLAKGQRIAMLFERINNTELLGTPSNTGQIDSRYPCDFSKLQEDGTPPGSGPCKVPALFGSLWLAQIAWLRKLLIPNGHEPLVQHWDVIDTLIFTQAAISVAVPWVLDGKRGATFGAVAFTAISDLFRQGTASSPEGTRAYGFVQDDKGYFLVGASHGETVIRKEFTTDDAGLSPYEGVLVTEKKRYIQNATDDVIRQHGESIANMEIAMVEANFNASGEIYIVSTGHIADGQGKVINVIVLLPRSVALATHNAAFDKTRTSVRRNTELINSTRSSGQQAMISVACVAGLIMSLASAALSLKITRSLTNLAKHMEAVASMDLDSIEDRELTKSRFTEVRRMQMAFIKMVENLRVYKSYMQPAVFAARSAVTPTSSQPEEATKVNPNNPQPLSPSFVGTPLEIQSIIGPNTCTQEEIDSEEDKHPLQHLINMGTRLRKGTILVISFYDTVMDDIPLFITLSLDAIRKHNGLILSFTAHRVIATWNVHQSCVRHAAAACECALEVSSKLQTVPDLPLWGMAVDTGLVRCGTAGDQLTRSLVCVGGPVNFATKVSQLAPLVGAKILASEEVVDRVRQHIEARVVDVVPTIPFPKSNTSSFVYELKGHVLDEMPEDNTGYTNGFSAFTQGEFAQAKRLLRMHLKLRADDHQARRLLKLTLGAELQGRKGAKYLRSYTGWEQLESATGSVSLPDGLEETYTSVRDAPTMLASTTIDDVNDADNLAKEIKNALMNPPESRVKPTAPVMPYRAHDSFETITTNTALSGGGATYHTKEITSTMMTLTTLQTLQYEKSDTNNEAPVKEFVDRTGVMWHRSDRVLGRGAYGSVWFGMCDSGELCALKTLPLEADSSKDVESLLNEVRVLSQLRDDHLVSYITSAVAGRHVFIAMELMPGGSVAGLLQQFSTLPQSAVVRCSKDMLKGLRFLHSNGIVHRDLKPANVLLQLDGTCKLADFGASERFGLAGKKGKINGTPLYMSPDACTGTSTEASDIWSLGITVAEMLTGEVPYLKELRKVEALVFIYKVVTGKIRPVLPANLCEQPRAFLEACFRDDPADRPKADSLLKHSFLLSG